MTERVLCVGAGLSIDRGLLSVARELAGAGGVVGVVVLESPNSTSEVPGAEHAYVVRAEGLDLGRPDHLGAVIVSAVRALGATVVLTGPARNDHEALARAGGALGALVLTGVRTPRVTGDGIEVTRDLLSGNATGVEVATSRPVLLALADVPAPAPFESGSVPSAAPTRLQWVPPTYALQRLSTEPKPSGGVDLESASRIVSVGRGLQRKEDLPLIEGLAAVLGAVVGCTRPIAADSGWLSEDHWVGLTGHRVRPALYVAVGISGAAQHLVGMRDSKLVIAINKDANAPIFQQADFQVVGDLYTFLPEFTKALTAARASK